MEGSVEVPEYFVCPISLQIMRDPVILSTGITYDRENIERWINGKHGHCPVTKQRLLVDDLDLTPNHTLRRLIQAWCAEHAISSVDDGIFTPPRSPVVDESHITTLLDEAASQLPQTQMSALQRLKSIVSESDRNRKCAEAAGAADFLVSIIKSSVSNIPRDQEQEEPSPCDEALAILCSLQLSEAGRFDLLQRNDDLIELLTRILSRPYALLLLKSLVPVIALARLMDLREEFFAGIVKVLRDDKVSIPATKGAALKVLLGVSCCKRNKVKAVQAGAVLVLIELLLGEAERRVCEMTLAALDQLCGCAEGRAELVAHAAGIAVVSKKILRVSQLANGVAVRILCSVVKLSPSPAVLQEMLQVGAVSKLCLMLQVDCGVKIKQKVKETLRLHSRVWRTSPCLASGLVASYP